MASMAKEWNIRHYDTVSTALALHSDRELGRLLDQTPVANTGIGGTAVRLEIEGVPVFAKAVALTDLESRPEHIRSTANLFDLPMFYQYGLGSAGFGVWRELAAHVMTTGWVLSGLSESFPLLYHWRVLPGPPSHVDSTEEQERLVAYWNGSAAVRQRLAAIAQSSAKVVLFLEHIPHNLQDWLPENASACDLLEQQLITQTTFMSSQGFIHFDAHLRNLLTDGQRLYFGDFGLASSTRFDLSPAELAFHREHRQYDHAHTLMELVRWLKSAQPDHALVERHEQVFAVMHDFYGQVYYHDRTVPFPAQAVAAALGVVVAQTPP